MSRSISAIQAVPSNSPVEVDMPKALEIVRAPTSDPGDILVKRDGKPDLLIRKGRLLLTVKTEPSMAGWAEPAGSKRWRVYRMFELGSGDLRVVIAIEGHSTVPGETTLYSAEICEDGAEIWRTMGKLDELKPVLAELNWPAVEEI
jgi:hypothetical protein